MNRLILAALAALMVLIGGARAAEIKAKIAKIDADKRTVTVTVDGTDDKEYHVAKDAEIFRQGKGRPNKPGPKEPIIGGLTGLTTGSEVTLNVIRSGSKEVVSAIRVETQVRKKKDKN